MSRTINAGFLGVGNFIGKTHLPHVFDHPRLRVHTLCDQREDLLDQRAARFAPLKTTTDYRAMLDDPEVDLVFIGTRGDQHARFVVEAARCGKHVVVEKPMTHTQEESEQVVKTVVENDVRLLVGFNRRSAEATRQTRALFTQVRDGPVSIYYRIVTDIMHAPDYYAFDLARGGGHMIMEGVHVLDILTWLVGSEPVRIYAQGALASDDSVMITFADGTVATFILSRNGGQCYPKEAMEIYTGRSTIVLDHFCELRADVYPDRFVRKTWPFRFDEVDDVPGRTGRDGGIELHYRKSAVLRESNAYWDKPLEPDKGHYDALDRFTDALLHGTPAPCDEIDGARATCMGLKALESIRRNAPVDVREEEYFLHLRRTKWTAMS
ncbi:MAG: hypothetical protein CMJ18_17595 [Phycisphaeraceae bacterium]|nr:hypothetical protein [Phycisphaeraceae bacterium]